MAWRPAGAICRAGGEAHRGGPRGAGAAWVGLTRLTADGRFGLGLDQSLAIITALLRIAEIEHSRRLEGFSQVQLAPLVREIGDLYEPIAEDKGLTLHVEAPDQEATVHGDRDFEAVANLVDNAVKF